MNTQTPRTPMRPTTIPTNATPVSGDHDATVLRYVEENQGLVRLVARRLSYQYGEDLDPETREDLYNECLQNGVFGLHRAAELYDAARGSFSNYACRWIFKRAKEAAEAWAETRRHASLDAPVGDEDDTTVGDLVSGFRPFELSLGYWMLAEIDRQRMQYLTLMRANLTEQRDYYLEK